MTDKNGKSAEENRNNDKTEDLLESLELDPFSSSFFSSDDDDDLLIDFKEIIADVAGDDDSDNAAASMSAELEELESFLEEFNEVGETGDVSESPAEQGVETAFRLDFGASQAGGGEEGSGTSFIADAFAQVVDEQVSDITEQHEESGDEPAVAEEDLVQECVEAGLAAATEQAGSDEEYRAIEQEALPEEEPFHEQEPRLEEASSPQTMAGEEAGVSEEGAEAGPGLVEGVEQKDETDVPVEMEPVELPLETLDEEQGEEPETAAMNEKPEQSIREALAEVTQPGPARKVVLGAIALGMVAFLLGIGAILMALGLKSQIKQLDATVTNLELKSHQLGQSDVLMEQFHSELEGLQRQLNEMIAITLEKPVEQTQDESGEEISEAIKALNSRLSKIEKSLTDLKQSQKVRLASTTQKASPTVTTTADGKKVITLGGGEWVVNLASLTSEWQADNEVKRLRSKGIEAVKQRTEKDGKTWYRLRVIGFANYDEAKAYARKLQEQSGIKNAWVGRE